MQQQQLLTHVISCFQDDDYVLTTTASLFVKEQGGDSFGSDSSGRLRVSYFASVLVRGLWRRLALGVVDDDSVCVIETPLDMERSF